MKKKGRIPVTRVKNPEPDITDPDWVIWAAWADRITFEEIEKKTGKTESEVIKGKHLKIVLKNRELKMAKKDYLNYNIKDQKKCIKFLFQL